MSPRPMTTRRLVVLLCGIAGLAWLSWYRLGSHDTSEFKEVRGPAFGTNFSVRSYGGSLSEQELLQNVLDEVEIIDKLMSTYRDDSELMMLSSLKAGESRLLSEDVAQVLGLSLDIAKLSGGAFDPTVAPLVRYFGFSKDPNREISISEAKADPSWQNIDSKIGYQKIELKDRNYTPSVDGLELDLSAVAKGYAVDRVAQRLLSKGEKNLLVEIGGEIVVHGNKGGGQAFRVGIEMPSDSVEKNVGKVIELKNQAVATSGDYRNFYERDGKRLSHTIDPRSKLPIDHQLAEVSVVASNCAEADAWATTLMVLGESEGFRLASEQKLSAMFIIREATGQFRVRTTDSYPSVLSNQ